MTDPVLDAYVAKFGPQPSDTAELTDRFRWKTGLAYWRAAWQEATLIEREAVCEMIRPMFNEYLRLPFEQRAYSWHEMQYLIDGIEKAILARTKP